MLKPEFLSLFKAIVANFHGKFLLLLEHAFPKFMNAQWLQVRNAVKLRKLGSHLFGERVTFDGRICAALLDVLRLTYSPELSADVKRVSRYPKACAAVWAMFTHSLTIGNTKFIREELWDKFPRKSIGRGQLKSCFSGVVSNALRATIAEVSKTKNFFLAAQKCVDVRRVHTQVLPLLFRSHGTHVIDEAFYTTINGKDMYPRAVRSFVYYCADLVYHATKKLLHQPEEGPIGSLEILSDDVLCEVLERCSPETIIAAGLSCRRLHRLAMHEWLWSQHFLTASWLYSFLIEKSTFLRSYHRNLVRRLMSPLRSVDDQILVIELKMLSALEARTHDESNRACIANMRELLEAFPQSRAEAEGFHASNRVPLEIDFSPFCFMKRRFMSAGKEKAEFPRLNLPACMAACRDAFTAYWKQKFPTRPVTFFFGGGSAELLLRYSSPAGPIELTVICSTLQALLLEKFASRSCITYQELYETSGFCDFGRQKTTHVKRKRWDQGDLKKDYLWKMLTFVEPLVVYKLLLKDGFAEALRPTDTLTWNEGLFASHTGNTKLRLLLPRLYENPFHPPAVGKGDDRALAIEAAVVRCCKQAGKPITLASLLERVCISMRLPITLEDVALAVHAMTDRLFIKRTGDALSLLEYVP
eukprot:TRINITY_DN2014_c0_g1_i6.p1 TRINITY_DN2014_c0_g1~~TRINITY_DN2014_c0_g1_i6.p1  ORF type:complete len:643 (-),score=81.74 TRINITY_DN2014_c0_g1_i6:1011-2939(-)